MWGRKLGTAESGPQPGVCAGVPTLAGGRGREGGSRRGSRTSQSPELRRVCLTHLQNRKTWPECENLEGGVRSEAGTRGDS